MDIKQIVKEVVSRSKNERGPISLYLDKNLYKEVKVLCKKQGISISDLVDEFFIHFIESMKAEPKKEKK